MGIMKRVSQYMRAKAEEALDRMEDPSETLDYSYRQQLEMLTKVQRGVADVMASRAAVEAQMENLRQEQADLAGQIATDAEAAAGSKALASQRNDQIIADLSELAAQHSSLREQEERLAKACEHLTSKVVAFGMRVETIKASYSAADARQKAIAVSQEIAVEVDKACVSGVSRPRRLEMLDQLRLSIEEMAAARERLARQADSMRQQQAGLAGTAGQRTARGPEDKSQWDEIDRQLSDIAAECRSLQAAEDDIALVCDRLAAKLEASEQSGEDAQDTATSTETRRQPGEQGAGTPEPAETSDVSERSSVGEGEAPHRAANEEPAKRTGFRRNRAAAESVVLTAQLGLVAAAEFLVEATGFTPTGVSSICFRAIETRAFRDVEYDVRDRLTQGTDNPPTVELTDDSYGYTWMVIRGAPDNFQSLTHRTYMAGSMLVEGGFGPQLLCSVTPFRDRGDRNVAIIYLYKRGTFYAFAPQSAESRNNELELHVKNVLQGKLPIEDDLSRWHAVWGAPGL